MKSINLLIVVFFVCLLASCSDGDEQKVVIYTSVDRHLSQPVFEKFTKKTGIRVLPVFDTEASKTVGLYHRLLAEKSKPKADVFWNSELLHTILLDKDGLLGDVPTSTGDKKRWVPVAARARALVIHDSVAQQVLGEPWSLDLLTDARFKGQTTFANPRYGTTKTHFLYLYNKWGVEGFKTWVAAMKNNDAVMLPGNAQVRDYVVRGTYLIGLTDTDDIVGALKKEQPVKMFLPAVSDHESAKTLVLPTTLALMQGAPNKTSADKFIQYAQSLDMISELVQGPGGFIPVLHKVPDATSWVPALQDIKHDMPTMSEFDEGSMKDMLWAFDTVWLGADAAETTE